MPTRKQLFLSTAQQRRRGQEQKTSILRQTLQNPTQTTTRHHCHNLCQKMLVPNKLEKIVVIRVMTIKKTIVIKQY